MTHQAVSQLVLGIFRLNGQIAAWGDRFAAASQLTTARWQVLGAIASGETPPGKRRSPTVALLHPDR